MPEPSALPTPAPVVTPETKPFWDATLNGTLRLPRCDECAFVIWYPRSFCTACGSTSVTWFDAEPRGTIHSYTVCYRGSGDYRDCVPYVLAYVDLVDGPRVMTNIIVDDPASLAIGDRVEAVFQNAEHGGALMRFRLAA